MSDSIPTPTPSLRNSTFDIDFKGANERYEAFVSQVMTIQIHLKSPDRLLQGQERNSKLIAEKGFLYDFLMALRKDMSAQYGPDFDMRPLHVELVGDSKQGTGETPAERVTRRSKLLHESLHTYHLKEEPIPGWKFMGKNNRAFVLELNPLEDGFVGHITVGFFKTKDMISEEEQAVCIQNALQKRLSFLKTYTYKNAETSTSTD